MDTMLTQIEKDQFYEKEYLILSLLEEIQKTWERDYSWVKIKIDMQNEIKYVISIDILKVIFDNLILNTVQQNDEKETVEIVILCSKQNGFLEFEYKDNGIGLKEKYLNDPMKILEVHETTRKNGHGLGMWIANNTITMMNGAVERITGNDGFNIQFTIGGKNV